MKWLLQLFFSLIFGIILAYGWNNTIDPYGNYVEWSIIFSIIIHFALLPPSKLAKCITGLMVGIACVVIFYLVAYYRNDLGSGAQAFFYWGMLSWSMMGGQIGLVGGVCAIGIQTLINKLNYKGQFI